MLSGLRRAAAAYGVPVLGGHTQLGVPASLAVTALGRAAGPVPGGGGRPGHRVRLTADLGGGWRPGYRGRQWDSTTSRRTPELTAMLGSVAAARPAAAKDVSMAGIAGTLGMLAEASGCAAVLDMARVPRPAAAAPGDWLTCFPGFAMLTDRPPARPLPAGPAVSAECGELRPGRGVSLRWPDGECIEVIAGSGDRIGASMTNLRMAAVAAPFGRDLEADFARAGRLIGEARAAGVRLLALPEACLGGYLAHLDGSDGDARRRAAGPRPGRPGDPPPGPDGRRYGGDAPATARPPAGAKRYNSAVCVTGDGVLGRHRKVHQPLRRGRQLRRGRPVRRVRHPGRPDGHDDLLRQGIPRIGAGAGPGRRRDRVVHVGLAGQPDQPGPDLAQDRWTRRFDLFDRARALENQIVWVSANQAGTFGGMRFVASAKVVDPGGDGAGHDRHRRPGWPSPRWTCRGGRRGPPGHGASARPAPRGLLLPGAPVAGCEP